MYRMICAAAALLVAAVVQPATADDISICKQATGDDAIAACTRMVARNPKTPNAYVIRGVAYFRRSDYGHAIADFDQAIRLNPNDADAYNDRAGAYYQKHVYDRAISDFNQATGSIRDLPNTPTGATRTST